jgi:hypothetical protein
VAGIGPEQKTSEHIDKFSDFTQSGFQVDISPAGGQTSAHENPRRKTAYSSASLGRKIGRLHRIFFLFRESRKLNARLTVLTVNELAEMHTNTFGVDDVIVTNPHPGLGELRRLVNQLSNVDAVVHLVGRLQPAEIVFMRLLRPASIYSLDDSLRCVNRKMGFAANTLNIVEQYKYILQDLGAKVIDTQYIVPLPAELPPAALSPKYFLILMPAEETRGYPLPVQPQLYKLSPTSFPAIPWEFFAALQRCTVHSIWKTQLHAIMWQSCTTG